MAEYPRIGFAESDLFFDEDAFEQRTQIEAVDLCPLLVRFSVGDEREPAGLRKGLEGFFRPGKDVDALLPQRNERVGDLGCQRDVDTEIPEGLSHQSAPGVVEVEPAEAMALGIGPVGVRYALDFAVESRRRLPAFCRRRLAHLLPGRCAVLVEGDDGVVEVEK